MMNSNFLTQRFLTEDRKKHCVTLCKLEEKARETLVDYIKSIDELPLMSDQNLGALAEKTGLSAEKAYNAYVITMYLCFMMAKFKDTPTGIAEDMKAMEILTEEQATILVGVLEQLREKARDIGVYYNRHDTVYEGAPGLLRIKASVSIKPLFEERYRYDKQPITEYKPTFLGFVPTALVEMHLNDGTGFTSTKTFQVSEQALDRFISDLLSLQTEMDVLKSKVNLDR